MDGKFVATGGADSRIVIWSAPTLTPLKIFKQHRSPVTGLVFRRNTNQMYSCSSDRSVKLWSLDELAYVETLFGHQDEVVGIDALASERCITVGARDRTARLWKIVDEAQLIFRSSGKPKRRGGTGTEAPTEWFAEGSIDCVTMIDEDHFITGSDNGSIALYSTTVNKPIYTVGVAHGKNPPLAPTAHTAESDPSPVPIPAPQPRPITALQAIPYSDTFFSGSYDGFVRVWKVSADKKKIERVGCLGIPNSKPTTTDEDATSSSSSTALITPPTPNIKGVINGISIYEHEVLNPSTGLKKSTGEIYVAIALGKEMRLGRWLNLKGEGRNGGMVWQVGKRVETKRPKPSS